MGGATLRCTHAARFGLALLPGRDRAIDLFRLNRFTPIYSYSHNGAPSDGNGKLLRAAILDAAVLEDECTLTAVQPARNPFNRQLGWRDVVVEQGPLLAADGSTALPGYRRR